MLNLCPQQTAPKSRIKCNNICKNTSRYRLIHLFIPSLNTLLTRNPGLNLATVTMHQPTLNPSKNVYTSVEMWQVCPAEKRPALRNQWRDLEQIRNSETRKNRVEEEEIETDKCQDVTRNRINLCEDQHTCRTEPYIQKSNFFPPLFLLFSSPWPFSSFYYSFKQECHFSFSHCQHPSALLSETSAIIPLSYYRSNGRQFIQSVTFM